LNAKSTATCFCDGTAHPFEKTFGDVFYYHHPYRHHRRRCRNFRTFFFAKAASETASDRGVVFAARDLGISCYIALSSENENENENEISNETPAENENEISNTRVFFLCLFLCTFRYLVLAEANANATFVRPRSVVVYAFRLLSSSYYQILSYL
jgi:hypothetical protein|tara:strand:- start:574 stop:1035 length:462 start_codon:yes stop_codon:yes gene_type:complete